MATYNLLLVRYALYTWEEVQREIVWVYTEAQEPIVPPIGAVLMALNYTTTCVAEAGDADGTFNIVMVRNDPFTEAFISRTVLLEGFAEDPEAQYPTTADICTALRSTILYYPELVPDDSQ